jgi:acetolactate synthase-1/3 small subunit
LNLLDYPMHFVQNSFVFELNGSPVKIDAFIDLMTPLGLSEISRTGVVAIARGSEKL